jgi:hypothetical protein
MKYLPVLSLAILIGFSSCEKDKETDNINPSDHLEQFGILGKWKLDGREYGGISSGAILCCDTLEFKPDFEPIDFMGLFKAVGAGYENTGVFELDNRNKTIEFKYDDKQKIYDIQISETTLFFNYLEDTVAISEWWIKQE